MPQLCVCEDEAKEDEVGEKGEYNPYERQGSSSSIQLENEIQAAIWMDCVAEMSCEKIADGYCAPVW